MDTEQTAAVLTSPEIKEIEWGRIHVVGYPEGKDFKLYPGGAEEWRWDKTNTHHVPGIQKSDVEDLLGKGADTIILSQGYHNQLEVAPETAAFLEDLKGEKKIQYFIKTTAEAALLYNELAKENKRVGALIHSTC